MERIAAVSSDSKLEVCLCTLLSSSEVLAAICARTILLLKVMRPMRLFTNNGEIGFSPADMGPIADSLFEFLCDLEADGSKGMDVSLDVLATERSTPARSSVPRTPTRRKRTRAGRQTS